MNSLSHTVETTDYASLLRKEKKLLIGVMIFSIILAVAAFYFLPKSYKSSTLISLQTQYFQIPLVSGFIPETLDPQELKSKREALMYHALNHDFLSEMATRYKILKDPLNSHELELFSKKFEIVPSSPSSYLISFTDHDPNIAYQVLQDFLQHLKNNMTEDRHTLLINLHDAIENQLEVISMNHEVSQDESLYSNRPEYAQKKINKIEEQISNLKSTYSEKHPYISELKAEISHLIKSNHSYAEAALPNVPKDLFSSVKVDPSGKDLFDDLIKKYRYLEIVIYMDQKNKDRYLNLLSEAYIPESPIFPRLSLLLVFGMMGGFLLGTFILLIRGFR